MPLVDNAIKQELARLYGEPGRFYHNIGHVEALLGLLRQHRSAFTDPRGRRSRHLVPRLHLRQPRQGHRAQERRAGRSETL